MAVVAASITASPHKRSLAQQDALFRETVDPQNMLE